MTLKVFAAVFVVTLLAACAAFAGPGVSLTTYVDWQQAVTSKTVQPYTTWDAGLESHYPGQSANFRDSTVTALNGFTLTDPPFVEVGPGLLMEWGADEEVGDLIAAWYYGYGEDPDLTRQIISISVFPPMGMSSISIGMKDAHGLIKSWGWNVGGPGGLVPGAETTISLYASGGAGQAGATSFWECGANTPLNPTDDFDITKVVGLVFDERGNWLNMTKPPAPLNKCKPYNCWERFSVVPDPVGIPEPSSLLALSAGTLGLAGLARRKFRK